MRFYAAIAIMLCVASCSCSRLSNRDLEGTVWESRQVDSDPAVGSVELVLSLEFIDSRMFLLKRAERWVSKKESVKTPLPEDTEVSGEYRVESNTIHLSFADGSSLAFSYKDGRIISHDESRTFVKAR